jgi:UDP:flavonoid glycosyltransferase YjiC (YdhE family)
MKTILFAPETINIAETTRMVEIAKLCKDRYNCVFVGYSDEYSNIIENAGFTFIPLKPWLTREKIEHLWKVDRMESFADPFTVTELRDRVASEIGIINELNVSAVIMGFTLSFAISARVTKTPLIYFMPFPLTEPFLKNNLANIPDDFYRGPIKLIPQKWLKTLINKWFLNTSLWIRPFKIICKEYNVKPINKLVELYQGDYNMITDLPELTGVKQLPANWFYVGFMFAKLDEKIPEIVHQIPTDKPIIYCAMGSSANREVLKKVLLAFSDIDCYVISPVKKHLEQMDITVPKNVFVTDWLPAHLVNPMARIAVIHGGQGTVQNAVSSGTPFIGIGLQPEQEANIDLIANMGSAVRIRKHELSANKLKKEVELLLKNDKAYQKAKELADIANSYNGNELIIKHLTRIIG